MSAAYASLLRHELRERNFQFVKKHQVAAQFSYGSAPVVVYEPDEDRHGNFISASYHAICDNEAWRKRLSKVHTSARVSLPKSDRKWCELDSCNSSDALLMNVFCYPSVADDPRFLNALGVEQPGTPIFGFKARVPLVDGKFDRTEVDLKLGDLLIESKLTESDFQAKSKDVVDRYRDFQDVFQRRDLPKASTSYLGYQLIRNVLAAHSLGCSFCVVCDARRPDLIEQWYAVMRCVKIYDLRTRCKVLTWQELSELLPADLAGFLDEKYGIRPGPITPYQFEHQRE